MTAPASEVVMQQLAQLLAQCNAYNRDHQRAIACLNSISNIAEQHQITKSAWQQSEASRYGTMQGSILCEENNTGVVYPAMIKQSGTLETLLARQVSELEQTIAELRRVWRQQSKQVYAMHQVRAIVQKWPIGKHGNTATSSSYKTRAHNEERELAGIISVHYNVARDWIESIVDGYTREHQWQQLVISPISSRGESHTKDSTTLTAPIDWNDAASIRQYAERWATLSAVDMTIEEKIQDYLRIYRLWQASQSVLHS
ncbi:hypothetical protein BDF22DRAFT_776827 [Syncephalis plumigaleata]|nr:hypothetical protein BDF22DRAFT_776827 [Syncephalis plumigaleata]